MTHAVLMAYVRKTTLHGYTKEDSRASSSCICFTLSAWACLSPMGDTKFKVNGRASMLRKTCMMTSISVILRCWYRKNRNHPWTGAKIGAILSTIRIWNFSNCWILSLSGISASSRVILIWCAFGGMRLWVWISTICAWVDKSQTAFQSSHTANGRGRSVGMVPCKCVSYNQSSVLFNFGVARLHNSADFREHIISEKRCGRRGRHHWKNVSTNVLI